MEGDFTRLPRNLREAITTELARGERILYAAKPEWRAGWGALFIIFLFAVFWCSISFMFFGLSVSGLAGLFTPMSDGKPASTGMLIFFLIFSLPFVAIGLVLLAAPFLGIRKALNTIHVVTDARLISVYVGRDKGSDSIPLSKINFLKRRDRKNGTGTLEIGYGVEKDGDGDPRPLTQTWTGIPGAKRAEALIREHASWVR